MIPFSLFLLQPCWGVVKREISEGPFYQCSTTEGLIRALPTEGYYEHDVVFDPKFLDGKEPALSILYKKEIVGKNEVIHVQNLIFHEDNHNKRRCFLTFLSFYAPGFPIKITLNQETAEKNDGFMDKFLCQCGFRQSPSLKHSFSSPKKSDASKQQDSTQQTQKSPSSLFASPSDICYTLFTKEYWFPITPLPIEARESFTLPSQEKKA